MAGAARLSTENHSSRLLSHHENIFLGATLLPECQSLLTSVAQLLVTDAQNRHEKWRKLGCFAVCFIKNNQCRSFFISAYDIQEGMLMWEQELYPEMDYQRSTPTFHTFEADLSMAALQFADATEADLFFNSVQSKLVALKSKHLKQKEQSAPKQMTLERMGATKQRSVAPQEHLSATSQGVVASAKFNPFSMLTSQSKPANNVKKKGARLTKADISTPVVSSFQHVSHVGFGEKGLEFDKNDPFITDFLSRAGLDMSTIKSKDEEEFIYGFIEKQGGLNAIKSFHTAASVENVKNKWLNNLHPSPQKPPRAPLAPSAPPPLPQRADSLPDLTQPPQFLAPPPPPPPPPPLNPICNTATLSVPPPPPPLPVSSSSTVVNSSRHALLGEIERGAVLRPVERDESATAGGMTGRDRLMNDIKSGQKHLRKVESSENVRSELAVEPLDGMALALARALQARRGAIEQQASEDELDELSDDEWDA